MNHVSASPTDGNGPTQGQRKTLTRVGIEPTTFGLDLRRSLSWWYLSLSFLNVLLRLNDSFGIHAQSNLGGKVQMSQLQDAVNNVQENCC